MSRDAGDALALGVSCSAHGAIVALARGGRLVRAARLERLCRIKRAVGVRAEGPGVDEVARVLQLDAERVVALEQWLPRMIDDVLASEGARAEQVAAVARPAQDLLDMGAEPAQTDDFLRSLLPNAERIQSEHHRAHALQAFLPSGWNEAAVVTIDGFGEHLTRLEDRQLSTTIGIGRGADVEILEELTLPFSVGMLYAAATSYLGFAPGQEGKTMGLAPYGDTRFVEALRDDFDLSGPLPRCRRDWPARPAGALLQAVGARLSELGPARAPRGPFAPHHKAVARAVQALCETLVVHICGHARARTGLDRLCLAGGVALNCVANRSVLDACGFQALFVPPEPGDPGLAVGLALHAARCIGASHEGLRDDFLGAPPGPAELEAAAETARNRGLRVRRGPDPAEVAARWLAAGCIIGRFDGASELGPRALGHRSILADPRDASVRGRLNRHIKRRETFRPFAPSALAAARDQLFELPWESPFMLLTAPVRAQHRGRLASAMHVDESARVQTVDAAADPAYHRLISAFADLSGCPAVVNTSFNVAGQPLVESPMDALETFEDAGLDALVLGPWLVERP